MITKIVGTVVVVTVIFCFVLSTGGMIFGFATESQETVRAMIVSLMYGLVWGAIIVTWIVERR